MSDDSDFSDEEIPLSASRHATRGSGKVSAGDDNEYRMTGALKVPRPTSYTTQALYDQIVNNDIDLCPEYQRDVVWPEQKQIGIVDSIFRNFYVPPLIFAVIYRDDGSEKRVCIDGKQRLTSIFRFMGGEIYHKDVFTKERFVYKDVGKFKGVKKLPDKYVKIFQMKQIVCMEYQDLTEDNEREIFQRVQLGMALTPAEKLQAISSPIAAFVRSLQSTYVNDGLAVELEWDTGRGQDFRCLVHAVYNMERWPSLNTVPGAASFQKLLQRPEELEDDFRARVRQTFALFLQLARDEKSKHTFKLPDVKKVAPVEFIAIATLIHVVKGKLTLAQLAEAIVKMRQDVRRKEVDIRMNSRVMKIMIDFIKELKPEHVRPDPGKPAAAKSQPLKRKRGESSEEEERVPPKRPASRSSPSMLTASQAHTMATASPVRRTPLTGANTSTAPGPSSPSTQTDRQAAKRAAKALATPEPPVPHMNPPEPASLQQLRYATHLGGVGPSMPGSPLPPELAALRASLSRPASAAGVSSPSLSHPDLARRQNPFDEHMTARMMAASPNGHPNGLAYPQPAHGVSPLSQSTVIAQNGWRGAPG